MSEFGEEEPLARLAVVLEGGKGMTVQRYWNPHGTARAWLQVEKSENLGAAASKVNQASSAANLPEFPSRLLGAVMDNPELGYEDEAWLFQLAWEIARCAKKSPLVSGGDSGIGESSVASEPTPPADAAENLKAESDSQRAVLFLAWHLLRGGRDGSTRLPLKADVLEPELQKLGATQADLKAVAQLLASLEDKSGLKGAGVLGRRGERLPLLVDGDWIAIQRLASAEERLAQAIMRRLQDGLVVTYPHQTQASSNAGRGFAVLPEKQEVEQAFDTVFNNPPIQNGQAITLSDEQSWAVKNAARRRVSFITGGPGTGKTSIVVSLLRVLLHLGFLPKDIVLAAPTGKAANRMDEAARNYLQSIPSLNPREQQLLEQGVGARTLHRLLGYSPFSNRYRHHQGYPLPEKVVVVDEASMIDLALMDRLLRAVAPDATLILLGDAEQLPSVDAGAVFRDLVNPQSWSDPAKAPIERLTRSFRMDPSDPAGLSVLSVANAINGYQAGQASSPLELDSLQQFLSVRDSVDELEFAKAEFLRIHLSHRDQDAFESAQQPPDHASEDLIDGAIDPSCAPVLGQRAEQPGELTGEAAAQRGEGERQIREHEQFKDVLQRFLERWFKDFLHPLLDSVKQEARKRGGGFWAEKGEIGAEDAAFIKGLLKAYEKQRVLCVTRMLGPASSRAVNRYFQGQRLEGGDLEPAKELRLAEGDPVMFEVNDYARGLFNGDQGVVLQIKDGMAARSQLMAVFPQGETLRAYPLSELGANLQPCYAMTVHKSQGSEYEKVALLLPDRDLPILTREILYTAVTRAKKSVVLVGTEAILERGIEAKMERLSGMAARLKELCQEQGGAASRSTL